MAKAEISGPLALPVVDPEGGFNVLDTRDGQALAWRGHLGDANAIATQLNASYPPGSVAPAWETLVHEITMTRIGGEPERSLDQVDCRLMIPESIGGPLDPGLWRPRGGC